MTKLHFSLESCYVFLSFSVLFLAIAIAVFVYNSKSKKQGKYLKENGRHLVATVTKVEEKTNIAVNGVFPQMIVCEVDDPQNGRKSVYKSEAVRDELSVFIGKSVDVYIDPADEAKAFVDLASLMGK